MMSALQHQNEKRTLAIEINHYIETHDTACLKEITALLEKYLETDKVELWSYHDGTLTALEDENKKISLSDGLTQRAIFEKTPQTENHIKSAKNINLTIDNPYNLNAKALLVYPVMNGTDVIGVIKLFMFVGNHRSFTKHKAHTLESFKTYFYHLFSQKPIDISQLHDKEKTVNTEPQKRSDEKSTESGQELQILKKKYSKLFETSKKNLKTYEKAIQSYKKREEQYAAAINKLQEELNTLKEERTDDQNIIKSLRSKVQDDEKRYKRNLKKYKEILQNTEKQEQSYQKKILQLETVIERYQRKESTSAEQKKEETIPVMKVESPTEEITEKETAEMIIQKTASHINTKQNMRILFDLTLFAASSAKSAATMEKVLDSTQFIKKLIDKHSLKHSIPIKKYRHDVEQTVEMIYSYQESIFDDRLNIQIRKHKDVPGYLYCDPIKIQHIVMYLLIDLFDITDKKQPVYIDMRYEKKVLTFKIKAKIDPEKKAEQPRFKKGGIFKSDDPRLCLKFAQKLTKYLNAEIDSSEQEEGYTHLFRISASDSVIDG
jgi:tropomyosin